MRVDSDCPPHDKLRDSASGSLLCCAAALAMQGAAGSGPFHDGTQVVLQTALAKTLQDKIEAPGSPFDAFAGS